MCRIADPGATYGYASNVWNTGKELLRAALWQTARLRGTLTYAEATALIRNMIAFDPHDFGFHAMLGQISVEEDATGRGMLSAIVVHLSDGQPGNGFYDLARQLGRDLSDPLACWVREVNRLYEEASRLAA